MGDIVASSDKKRTLSVFGVVAARVSAGRTVAQLVVTGTDRYRVRVRENEEILVVR